MAKTISKKAIEELAKKYDISVKVVEDLIKEGFTIKEADEIIREAEY